MCLYATEIRNRKYTANKKNGGIIPPVLDTRTLYVQVTCGECMECRKAAAREWQIRLMEDIRHHEDGKFVAFTFSNEAIAKLYKETEWRHDRIKDGVRKTIKLKNGKERKYYKYKTVKSDVGLEGYARDNAIAKWAVRKFLENWRKKHGKSVRHWLITELGHEGTENIHLHGIIWTKKSYDEIRSMWKYGYIWPRKGEEKGTWVNDQTVNYVIKYVHKQDQDHPNYKPKILASAGIGRGYTDRTDAKNNEFKGAETDDTYRTRSGHKVAMPKYWRNKIYSDEEREALWLHKLDKQVKWVCGEKVDIQQGEKEYQKLVKWYRRINKELGYGDGKPNWKQAEYEKARREAMYGKRLEERKYGTPAAGSIQKDLDYISGSLQKEEQSPVEPGMWRPIEGWT